MIFLEIENEIEKKNVDFLLDLTGMSDSSVGDVCILCLSILLLIDVIE